MAELTHVDLRRSRVVAATAVCAVVGLLLLLSLLGRLIGLRTDRDARQSEVAELVALVVRFPLPQNLTLPRLLWVLVTFAAIALILYGSLTGLRRSVPARQGALTVFLLGWCCTALAVFAGGYLSMCADRLMWPGLEFSSQAIGYLLPRSGVWALAFAWVGGVGAAVAYSATARNAAPVLAADGRRAAVSAGLAAAAFAVLLGVFGSLGHARLRLDLPGMIYFPDPVSGSSPGISFVLLALMIIIGFVALALLLGVALRRSGVGGAFVLGWGFAVLVAGGVGIVRNVAVLIWELVKGEKDAPFYWTQLGDGAAFGLLTGWVVGLVAAVVMSRK
ncbi:hypothetical protein ACIBG8_40710 [Nonomuraea sp. NPDC050556]|uniref:hypothetical protein n=1 Tax=Nonomuraea sp. NPDC050556 TaxID=3364369 RepID=UPI0037A33739